MKTDDRKEWRETIWETLGNDFLCIMIQGPNYLEDFLGIVPQLL
jgi:hypothetical protein